MYELRIDERVAKELQKIPAHIRELLRKKIHHLADNPRPPGCGKLSGEESYRIRQGKYRVLYEIDDKARIVTVYRAGPRSDVYKR